MSGTNNNAERERSGSAPPDHQDGDHTLDGKTEFSRACTEIVQQFQTGQLTYMQSMVQIALKIAGAGIAAPESEGVAQHYITQLKQVKASLAHNSQTGERLQDAQSAVPPIQN